MFNDVVKQLFLLHVIIFLRLVLFFNIGFLLRHAQMTREIIREKNEQLKTAYEVRNTTQPE